MNKFTRYTLPLMLVLAALAQAADTDTLLVEAKDAYGRQDYATARESWTKAAAAGNAIAQNNLGVIYKDGQGVKQDYARAQKLFEQAAAAGNSNAQKNLGDIYARGLGVKQDYAEARQWYEKAAVGGDAGAQNNMAFFYERGLGGVKPDAAKARYWLEKSAAQGNATAQRSLALLKDRPTVIEVNTRLSPEGTEQLEITRKRLSPEGAEQVEIIRKQPSSPEDAELVESIRRMDQRDPRGFLYHNGYYDGHQVTEEEIEAARRYLQGDGSKK